ncbi:MAG: hypothetical protein J0M02_10945, partial [Planctomycetes bacterium]|nr:hypothetical protein [Planctomycetota bacterium]
RQPAAAAIPDGPWRAAVAGAVANGLASLIARQQAEENSTGLMVPPQETKKIEGYETKQVPHSRQMVKEPIFEWREVQQMVPKRDEHGYVIGTELKTVKVPGKVTGFREVERLVPDPAGAEMVDRKVPIYAAGGPALWSKGTIGFNGIALHVLARAGLAGHEAATKQAEALETFLRETGLPDTTFDLAWCVIGLCQMPASEARRDLVLRLASKLIDGQARDGAAAGLWGPVSISAQQLAVLLEQYYRLDAEIAKMDAQLAEAKGPAAARLQAERSKLNSQRNMARGQMRDCAAQGHRLTAITKPWNPDGQDNAKDATRELAGLACYPYNRQIGDLEDTALALQALAELKTQGQLPAAPRRVVKGVSAPTTASGIALAAKAVAAAQLPDGTSTAMCVNQPVRLFDQLKAVQIPDVPFRGAHPALLSPRTLQTSLAGAAALQALKRLDPATVKPETVERAEAAAAHALAVWPTVEGMQRERLRWYSGLVFDNATLQARKGLLLAPPEAPVKGAKAKPAVADAAPDPLARIGADLPLDELAISGSGGALALAPHLIAWPLREGWQAERFRQAGFAVLAGQDEHGQWNAPQGNPAYNTAETALIMEQDVLRFLRVLDCKTAVKAEGGKGDEMRLRTPTFDRIGTYERSAVGTVMSLLLLAEGLAAPISLEGIVILPALPADGSGTPRTPEAAATAAQRPNVAFIDLLKGMGATPPPAGAIAEEPRTEEVDHE